MGRIIEKSEGYAPPDAGTYPARLTTVALLGWYPDNFNGGKPREMIGLEWTMDIGHESAKVTEILNLSFSTASKLYGRVRALQRMDDSLDLETLPGGAALLTIEHKITGDKTRAVVAAAAPLPSGTARPAGGHHDLLYYDWEGSKAEDYERLPRLFRWKIDNDQVDAPVASKSVVVDPDDEIPF